MANNKNGVCPKNKEGKRNHIMVPIESKSGKKNSVCTKCGYFPVKF